jgi:hypothetical protein
VRKVTYCRTCFTIAAIVPDGGPEPDWVEKCHWCLERELERDAAAAAKLMMWAPRRCADPDCQATFVPAVTISGSAATCIGSGHIGG